MDDGRWTIKARAVVRRLWSIVPSLIEDHQPEQDGQVEHGSEEQTARALARVGEGGVDARPEEKYAEREGAVEVDQAGRPQNRREEADGHEQQRPDDYLARGDVARGLDDGQHHYPGARVVLLV